VDGPGRDPEDRCDLGRGQADVVRQDQRRALLHGECEKGSFELVAIDELAELIDRRRVIDRQDRDLDRAPLAAPDVVLAGVDEEAMEPGVEPIGVAQTPKIAPGPDQGVLDGILCGIPVAEDPPRDRVQAVVCRNREGLEGLVVASLCALDELGRHRYPSVRHGNLPC
jgi:hypothetical protein